MPFVRDRIVPEVELAGRAKQFLDVLIWVELTPKSLRGLRALMENC